MSLGWGMATERPSEATVPRTRDPSSPPQQRGQDDSRRFPGTRRSATKRTNKEVPKLKAPRRTGLKRPIALLTALSLLVSPYSAIAAVAPESLPITPGSAVCTGGSQDFSVSITLPPQAVANKVDVFFAFDDTGSFTAFVPSVTSIFSGLVGSLETALPGVEFGFGVGRFEDYGGAGTGFSSELAAGRPFILNQPIVTAATAGTAAARDGLIGDALGRTAPGYGGDGPESSLEALYQVATGAGFDGDGNGSSLDNGNAGDVAAQTAPGNSGDVPAFATNAAVTSGTLGGVGWRPDALHLAILATDVCPVAAFPASGGIPPTVSGAGGVVEPASAFACGSVTAGNNRFGFVSDAKASATNTVTGAVVPAGAGNVQGTVDALNALGIRVIGMGPGAAPSTATGPAGTPSVFLSALGRLTGALDATGSPLVFSTSTTPADLSAAIANAITTAATRPVDIELTTTTLPAGLSVTASPSVVTGVGPGGTATFDLRVTGGGSAISGGFEIQFKDRASGALLGSIPATVDCTVADTTPPTCSVGTAVGGKVTATVRDVDSGLATIAPTTASNATIDVPAFEAGTTDPVSFTVKATDPKQSAVAKIAVTDRAGNVVNCDPISIVVVPGPGKPGEHCHGGIHHHKRHVWIKHLSWGVTRIEVEVGGKKFWFKRPRPGQKLDISSAYQSDTDNSVKIRVFGADGASATVVPTE